MLNDIAKNAKMKRILIAFFALNVSFAGAKMPIYGNFTGAEENHLFDKKLEINVHRKKYI